MMKANWRVKATAGAALFLGAALVVAQAAPALADCISSKSSWPSSGSTKTIDVPCGSPAITVRGIAGRDSNGDKWVYIGCIAGTCNNVQLGSTTGFTSGGSVTCSTWTTATGGSSSTYSGCSSSTQFNVAAVYGPS